MMDAIFVFIGAEQLELYSFKGCRSKLPNMECSENYTTRYENGSCYINSTFIGLWDYRKYENVTGIRRVLPSEEYLSKSASLT